MADGDEIPAPRVVPQPGGGWVVIPPDNVEPSELRLDVRVTNLQTGETSTIEMGHDSGLFEIPPTNGPISVSYVDEEGASGPSTQVPGSGGGLATEGGSSGITITGPGGQTGTTGPSASDTVPPAGGGGGRSGVTITGPDGQTGTTGPSAADTVGGTGNPSVGRFLEDADRDAMTTGPVAGGVHPPDERPSVAGPARGPRDRLELRAEYTRPREESLPPAGPATGAGDEQPYDPGPLTFPPLRPNVYPGMFWQPRRAAIVFVIIVVALAGIVEVWVLSRDQIPEPPATKQAVQPADKAGPANAIQKAAPAAVGAALPGALFWVATKTNQLVSPQPPIRALTGPYRGRIEIARACEGSACTYRSAMAASPSWIEPPPLSAWEQRGAAWHVALTGKTATTYPGELRCVQIDRYTFELTPTAGAKPGEWRGTLRIERAFDEQASVAAVTAKYCVPDNQTVEFSVVANTDQAALPQ